MRRLLPVVILLAACGTGSTVSKDETDSTADSDSTVDSDGGDTFEDTATVCEPVVEASTACATGTGTALVGTLVDQDGTPLGGRAFRVQYCRDTCLVTDCYDGNSFGFNGIKPGNGSFEIVPTCADERFATPFAPIVTKDGESRSLNVVMPRLDAGATLPEVSAELEVTKGVFLTAGKDVLAAPTPLDPDPTEIAGVDATDFAVPIEGMGAGTVLAVWYLSPFDYAASTPMPVRFDNAWKLEDSDGAELWMGDYEAFLNDPDTEPWVRIGALTVDGDGKLTPGAGLPKLSTIVLFQPTGG